MPVRSDTLAPSRPLLSSLNCNHPSPYLNKTKWNAFTNLQGSSVSWELTAPSERWEQNSQRWCTSQGNRFQEPPGILSCRHLRNHIALSPNLSWLSKLCVQLNRTALFWHKYEIKIFQSVIYFSLRNRTVIVDNLIPPANRAKTSGIWHKNHLCWLQMWCKHLYCVTYFLITIGQTQK